MLCCLGAFACVVMTSKKSFFVGRKLAVARAVEQEVLY